jgi:hypothetical protein
LKFCLSHYYISYAVLPTTCDVHNRDKIQINFGLIGKILPNPKQNRSLAECPQNLRLQMAIAEGKLNPKFLITLISLGEVQVNRAKGRSNQK